MKNILLLIFCLQVNTDGIISFDGGSDDVNLGPFDGGYARPVVAPLSCDISTLRNRGRVYYRSTTDNATLQRATSDVSNGTDFVATFVIIATWFNVTHAIPWNNPDVSKLRINSYPLSASKSKGSLCRPVPRGPAYVDQAYCFI